MMNNIPIDIDSLKSRRKTLRVQRRFKAWQGVWRFLALLGMMGGLIWMVSWAHWMIRDKSQIKIVGNRWCFPFKRPSVTQKPFYCVILYCFF